MPANSEHRTLHQALRAASINPLNTRSFVKLALGCGFISVIGEGENNAATPTSHHSESSHVNPCSSSFLFPTAKAIGGVADLINRGRFCIFPVVSAKGMDGCEEVRCDPVEPLGVVILLFPECFLEKATTPTGADPLETTESLEELLGTAGYSQSLDTSLDSITQSSAATTTQVQHPVNLATSSRGLGGATTQVLPESSIADLREQRDLIVINLISEIDEQVKRGSARLLAIQHGRVAHAKSQTVTHPTVPSGPVDDASRIVAAHLGQATMIGTQQRLARLHLWKLLCLSCLSHCATSEGELSAWGIHETLERIAGSSWAQRPIREWGWASLTAAETQYDEILEGLKSRLVQTLSNRAPSARNVLLGGMAGLLPMAVQTLPLPCPPSTSPTYLPQASIDISELKILGSSSASMFMFNDVESHLTALFDAATQRKVSQQQLALFGSLIEESFTGGNYRTHARQRIMLSFLSRDGNIIQLAERNKELFLLIFKALAKADLAHGAGEPQQQESNRHALDVKLHWCRDAMASVVTSMTVAEPSCHIMKVLHDEKLINDEQLSRFVASAIEEVGSSQSSPPTTASPPAGSVQQQDTQQQRIQRAVTLLALMLQNMCLANRRIVVTEPVDNLLLGFCMEHSKVKACSELYQTLMSIRGAKR